MQIFVGTSGYAYREWKGHFYPPDLPASRMLTYYGERFRGVEINNTFYRMPRAAVLEGWANEVPSGFRFALKAPQKITHLKRLRDVAESVSYLLAVAGTLKERLGPLLFQLPHGFRKDPPLLRDFLLLLPREFQVAFEFRDESWFDEEVFSLLSRHNAALCVAEADDGPHVPRVSTADFGYLRLRRQDYGEADLKAWAQRVREEGWREAYVFFKHEGEARGPQLARRFLELAP